MEKAELTTSIHPTILKDFQNQEYPFPIPKFQTWLAEKQQQQQEHRQLQIYMLYVSRKRN